MNQRLARAREHSETEYFDGLLLSGEFLAKLFVALLVSASVENKEGDLYRIEWQLIRADSLGKWIEAAQGLMTGTQSNLLQKDDRTELDELSTTTSQSVWHRQATEALYAALTILYPASEKLPKHTSFIHWMLKFGELRNKTRGHGAHLPEVRAKVTPYLERAIGLVSRECPTFNWPLVFAEQEMSGKWRIESLDHGTEKASNPIRASNGMVAGIYLARDTPRCLKLFFTTSALDDFWFPNGNFREKKETSTFEVISYISGGIELRSGEAYRSNPTLLPASTTAAKSDLHASGKAFCNAPAQMNGYIRRPVLEEELAKAINSEHRYPIVTLVGRGGIGKTSLALDAIERVSLTERFYVVVWFSARDIDLLDHGPKKVTPDVGTLDDIARSYKKIIGDPSKTSAENILSAGLSDPSGGPTLFVFDNFETVVMQEAMFHFIDERVRLPNKVLITTRHRSFKGDYAIEVGGMERNECMQLIADQAEKLAINGLLTTPYKDEIIVESEGHPYVIKILLGEVAKQRKLGKVGRIVASRDEILDALFDRTFRSLSEAGRRVFLTLCAWRSTIPVAAIEAVLLSNVDERIPVQEAIDELERFSFVEVLTAKHASTSVEEHDLWVSVPLAAALFGERKLNVSPDKAAVEADVQILKDFGGAKRTDVQHGIGPRVQRMFKAVSASIEAGEVTLSAREPMLQFLARKWPPAWLLLAALRQQVSKGSDVEGAKQAVSSYLEVVKGLQAVDAWKQLGVLCKQSGDLGGEIQAWAEMSAIPDIPFYEVSKAANRFNSVLKDNKDFAPTAERQILLRSFAKVMDNRLSEASADDHSRLAWLYMHLHDEDRAHKVAVQGLKVNPDNEHCLKIRDRILQQSRLRS